MILKKKKLYIKTKYGDIPIYVKIPARGKKKVFVDEESQYE